MRRAIRSLVALLAVLALPVGAGAAEPATLGAALTPTPLIFESTPWLRIENRSTVPAVVVLSIDGEGWRLDRSRLVLDLGERDTVTVSKAGTASGTVYARVSARDRVPGQESGELVLSVPLQHQPPPPAAPLWLLLLVPLVLLLGLRWRVRHAH
jgi:hypothetical protein